MNKQIFLDWKLCLSGYCGQINCRVKHVQLTQHAKLQANKQKK